MTAKIEKMVPYFALTGRRVPLSDGLTVPEEFMAKFLLSSGVTVELEVRVAAGRARAVSVSIFEPPGAGLTGLSINGVTVASLLETAVTGLAWVTNSAGSTSVRTAAGKTTRRRVNAERLARITEIVGDRPPAEAVDDVAKAEHVSERQAYRLIERAREARR